MTLNDWINHTVTTHPDPEIAVLEIRFLVTHITGITPTKQRIDNPELTSKQIDDLNSCALRLIQGEPLAYILGNQPFYDINLHVTPDTLIPRSDTEMMVDRALVHIASYRGEPVVYDLGTGSGAIAIAIAEKYPNIRIIASDNSARAIQIAQYNAQCYGMSNISFVQTDWLQGVSAESADIIISNPPYIAHDDSHLQKLVYEPAEALIAAQRGYADLFKIIRQAPRVLKTGGWLLVEHGITQGKTLRRYITKNPCWHKISTFQDGAHRDRFTEMQKID